MIFWLVIVVLTVASLVLAFAPGFRLRSEQADDVRAEEFAHDMAVYKDQLDELEREKERNVISEDDAKNAHVEIARRLLAAEEKHRAFLESAETKAQRAFSGRILAGFALLFVPGIAFLFYTSLGSPQLEAQPLAARLEVLREQQLATQEADQQLLELVARAEAHLEENPEDGRGWEVLAPIYFRTGELPKSVDAYQNAIRLLGESTNRLAGLGEATVALEGGVVTAEAGEMFAKAFDFDRTNGRAMYYLGLAEAQAGRPDDAARMWRRIVDNQEIEANWRIVAAESMSELARRVGQTPQVAADPSVPGPDAETVAAAEAMSEEDRQAMIFGMVEQLDTRLQAEGGSIDEWKRLIRAHVVLDQQDEAQNALDRALVAFEGKQVELNDIRQFARLIGVGAEALQTQ